LHELSLCQSLLDQLEELARAHDAAAVDRVEVQVGVLSGVEAQLLEQAFIFARSGTIAEHATLVTEVVTPRIDCLSCGLQGDARADDLTCASCGSPETRLIRGQELILARVLLVPADAMAAGAG
jgi:hydrogenase nickel incorporation protein HypA/HybF